MSTFRGCPVQEPGWFWAPDPACVPSSRESTSQNSHSESKAEPGCGCRATSPSQSSRAGEGWPGRSDGPSEPQAGAVGSSGEVVPVGRVGIQGENAMLSCFELLVLEVLPGSSPLTEEKSEALRSQDSALADPKNCSTPLPGSLPSLPQPHPSRKTLLPKTQSALGVLSGHGSSHVGLCPLVVLHSPSSICWLKVPL